MSQTTENQSETIQEEKPPLGLVGNPNETVTFTMPQFIHLMKVLDEATKLVSFIKNESIKTGTIKYYFQEDLTEIKDQQGNTLLTKNEKGEDVPQLQLKSDFWSN